MKQYTSSIRGKLFKYFQAKLRIKQSTKGWWRCDCPFCAGNYTFGIHLENYKAHCFKCGEATNPIELLMHIQGFQTYTEARGFLNIQQEYEAYDRMLVKDKVEYKPLELPESFKLLIQGNNMMAKAARHYITKRGFDVTKLSLNGVGYCTEGEYAGYIIFPYYKKSKLVYFQGRLYMGTGTKMKNPTGEQYGIGKSQLIYNEDALFMYNKIYTLESITNCLTLGDNAIALSGKSISPYQMSRLLQSPCKRVIILLDPDAWKEALALAMQLVQLKEVKAVRLPEGKDVNDLGKAKTLEFVRNTPYQKYMELYKLKLNEQEPIPTYHRIPSNYSSSRGAS